MSPYLQCCKDQHLFLCAVDFFQEDSPPGLFVELVYSDSVILDKETVVGVWGAIFIFHNPKILEQLRLFFVSWFRPLKGTPLSFHCLGSLLF
jgi:hypothetical protein